MLYKGSVYLKVGEVGRINGVKVKAIEDIYPPQTCCKACCFGGNNMVDYCFKALCQKNMRIDDIGVIFEFVE